MTSGTSPKWTHIPADRMTETEDNFSLWYSAYTKTLTPHMPEDTAERNRVYMSTKKVLQEFVAQFLRFPPVTDEDRDRMGIPNRKTRRKRIPAKSRKAFCPYRVSCMLSGAICAKYSRKILTKQKNGYLLKFI
jgi:hypothetical protein